MIFFPWTRRQHRHNDAAEISRQVAAIRTRIKDFNMALLDDIATLDTTISNALAAASDGTALTAANAQIASLTSANTDLTNEVASADTAVNALITKYTPATIAQPQS